MRQTTPSDAPVSRRTVCAALAAVSTGICSGLKAAVGRFTIVTASREAAHLAALDGLQQALAARFAAASTVHLPADDGALRQELESGENQLAIAIGIDAVRAVLSQKSRIPIVATMVFRTDVGNLRAAEGSDSPLAGVVWLDMPVTQVVAGLRVIFPAAARLGIANEIAGQSHPLPPGVSVKAVACANASELLASMRTLRNEVDFLICLPDTNIFNKTTVEPLILASLEHKLPLVGFSASFARAGAAVGVYPDFTDLGHQTAALAERCVGAPAQREEHPRRSAIAVNERVLHLLGRDYRPKPDDEVLVIR